MTANGNGHKRDTVTRFIWVLFGIVQAIVSMLMAFNVVDGTDLAAGVTATTLVLYVAANELIGRGRVTRSEERASHADERTSANAPVPSLGTTEGGTAN